MVEEEKIVTQLLPFSSFVPEDILLNLFQPLQKLMLAIVVSASVWKEEFLFKWGCTFNIGNVEHFDINMVSAFVDVIKNDSNFVTESKRMGNSLDYRNLVNTVKQEHMHSYR